jgi:DNA-binding PadR family transcriptional regulator
VAPRPELPQGFDRLLEHRLRLALCVLLARYERLSFARLKELTEETDGNLGANLRKLEDEGYLTAEKTFEARKPVTWYALTAAGERALRTHLDALSALIRSARR